VESLRKSSCAQITAGAAWAVLGTACAAVLVTAGATPAVAHTALKSSNPKSGAKLGKAPEAVELTFTEPLRGQLTRIAVRGPGDEEFQNGPPQVTSGTVSQPLRPLKSAGQYQIVYRVVAADGHPLAGKVRFTLTAAEASSASPAATGGAGATPSTQSFVNQSTTTDGTGTGDDISPWVLAIAVVALVACVAGAVLFGRKVTRGLD
jgi:copper resistance protein C